MDTLSKLIPPVISPPNKQRGQGTVPAIINIPPFNLEQSCKKPKRKKQKLGAPKNLWSPREDRILEEEVQKLGEKAWSEIAAKLPGRVGKQCRDRWRNHLCPEVKKGSWTGAEDKLLFEYRDKLGNQWAEIAKHIPGRTDLSVKNRYYSFRRKIQRQERRQKKVKFNALFAGEGRLEQELYEKGNRAFLESSHGRDRWQPGLSKIQSLANPGLKNSISRGYPIQPNPFTKLPRKICGIEALPSIQETSAPLLPLPNAFNTNMLNMNLLALCNMSNGLTVNDSDLISEVARSTGINRIGSTFKFNPLDFNTPNYLCRESLELMNRSNLSRASLDSVMPGTSSGLLPNSSKRNTMLSATSMYKNPICHVPLTELKQHFA